MFRSKNKPDHLRKPNYCFCAVSLLLTYKAKLTPKEIVDRLKEKFPYYDGTVVSTEKYKSGMDHHHVYVQFQEPEQCTLEKLDYVGGVHGYYQPVRRTPFKVIAYVTKYKNYIVDGCITEKTIEDSKTQYNRQYFTRFNKILK